MRGKPRKPLASRGSFETLVWLLRATCIITLVSARYVATRAARFVSRRWRGWLRGTLVVLGGTLRFLGVVGLILVFIPRLLITLIFAVLPGPRSPAGSGSRKAKGGDLAAVIQRQRLELAREFDAGSKGQAARKARERKQIVEEVLARHRK